MNDAQKQAIEEMKKAQARKAAVEKKTGRVARGGSVQKSKAKLKLETKPQPSVDERVKQLEEQLAKQKAEKADLKDQLSKQTDMKSYKEEQQALNDIVKNNDDYHFVKEYTVSTTHGKKEKIVVKMHAPSVIEQSDIQQEYADLTRGRGAGFVPMASELFLAIAYFRVVGDNVPKWFTDVEHTYRTDILLEAFEDFEDWVSDFLPQQSH